MLAVEAVDRSKFGVEEGTEMVSSDGFLEDVHNKNIEGAVY